MDSLTPKNNLQTLLQSALQLHQQGSLEEALNIYLQILEINPKQPDALHLAGAAYMQSNKNDLAIDYITRSTKLNPKNTDAWNNLGISFFNAGKYMPAIEAYKKCIKLNKSHFQAHNNLGNVYREIKNYQNAIKHYKSAIAINPNYPAAENNLGNALKEIGKKNSAIKHYQKAIKLNPNFFDALKNIGLALNEIEQHKEAAEYLEKCIALSSASAEVFYLYSCSHIGLKQYEPALKQICNAIEINATNSTYWYIKGTISSKLEIWDKAIDAFNMAIKIDPKHEKAYIGLAAVYKESLDYKKAEETCLKALELNKNNYFILNDLGIIERLLGKHQKSIESLKLSLKLLNSSTNKDLCPSKIHNNLGLDYLDIMQLNKARPEFDQAIKINNSYIKAIMSRAMLDLWQFGDYQSWWNGYEHRHHKLAQEEKYEEINRLESLDINNRHDNTPVVILPEQGVGDEIMFASIVPDFIKSYKSEIILACDKRLTGIFQRSFPQIKVTRFNGLQVTTKYQKIYLASLAQHFRKGESDFPITDQYIFPLEKSKRHFQEKYSDIDGLKIGISWKSGNTTEGEKRSITLDSWTTLLNTSGCTFFNLQYGETEKEIQAINNKITNSIICDDEVDPLIDMENFIALSSTLDLIITIDNSTAHIGGALGIPTWVMLPYCCEWRWLRDRKDSIWYKSLRLYRQQEIGNWSNVIEEVAKELTQRNIQPRAESKSAAVTKPDCPSPQPNKPVTPSKKQKKIAFLNDTSEWYHWGCTATSSAIRKRFAEHGFGGIYVPINHTYDFKSYPQTVEQFEDVDFFKQAFSANMNIYNAIEAADLLVINGEGSIHHLSPVSLSLLYIAFAAKKFKDKPVHIINHSPYPDNVREAREDFAFQLYRSIYNQLDYVAIREHISHKLMTDYGTRAELSFDCLPITVTEDYKPESLDSEKNIVISGSVSFTKERIADLEKLIIHFSQKGYKIKILLGAKAFPAQDDVNFVRELLKLNFKGFEVIDAKSLTEWLDCLNSAAVFVSGRFHHSLASIYLETPCVMMESNTLKNAAIAETFGLPEPIKFDSNFFFDELLQRIDSSIGAEPVDIDLRSKLLKRSEVNFDALRAMKN